MLKSIFVISFLCFSTLLTGACQEETAPLKTEEQLLTEEENVDFIQCPQNRPDVCTQIYQPVCGLVDTGIRCITTPCPSAEYQTFGNACTACGDQKVSGYVDGECESGENEENDVTE